MLARRQTSPHPNPLPKGEGTNSQSAGSRMTGSITFVLRSTAKTIVRCSTPSQVLATSGNTCRRSGRLKRTAKRSVRPEVDRLAAKGDAGVGMRDAVNDQLGLDVEVQFAAAGGEAVGPASEAARQRLSHGTPQLLLEDLLQFAAALLLDIAAAHRVDAVEVLGDFGPVLVEAVRGAALRRADDVAPREAIKAVAGGQVADLDLVALRRVLDVDVPVVHAAVDFDVANQLAGGGRGAVAADLVEPEDGMGFVPMLAHGRPGPVDPPPAEFPIGVQPVGIADHDDQPVLAVAVCLVEAVGGQVLGLGQLGLDLVQLARSLGLRCFFSGLARTSHSA